jgi:UDPglucose 6-dehydrogenase
MVENGKTIVQRSTCVPGTAESVIESLLKTDRINGKHYTYVVMPEFLREATAIEDALNPELVVVGTQNQSDVPTELLKLISVYSAKNVPTRIMTLKNAEATKYANNTILPMLISFWNELYLAGSSFCDDLEQVCEAVSHNKQLKTVRRVFGKAYGGTCFPKDTKALHTNLNRAGIKMPLLKATIDINEIMKEKYGTRTEGFKELTKDW